MTPPVFEIASADTGVQLALGSSPMRFWPFARAPKPGEPGYAVPYAVWQITYGSPENTLACSPDIDLYGVQVDTYAQNASQARAVAAALRDAFESTGNHIVAWNGEEVDPATGLYRLGFTAEFWTPRTGS